MIKPGHHIQEFGGSDGSNTQMRIPNGHSYFVPISLTSVNTLGSKGVKEMIAACKIWLLCRQLSFSYPLFWKLTLTAPDRKSPGFPILDTRVDIPCIFCGNFGSIVALKMITTSYLLEQKFILWETKNFIYFDITTILQACDSEEDGLFGFDVHSDGDGQR